MRRPLALLFAALLAGCGGGGHERASTTGRGRVAFVVHWPASARYIPSAANFIRLSILRGTAPVGRLDFLRADVGPGGGTDTKVLADTLAEGDYTLRADAYAEVPPGDTITEAPLASSPGTDVVTVVGGETVTRTVTMASNLTGFRVALRNLATSAPLADLTLSDEAPVAGPNVRPSAILQATIVPQTADGDALVLYPAGKNATTTLTASGNLQVFAQEAAGSALTATLAPRDLDGRVARLRIDFADPGTPALSRTLDLGVTGVAPLETAAGDADAISGVALSPADAYVVEYDRATPSDAYLRTVGGGRTFLGSGFFAASAANGVVAYGDLGGNVVSRFLSPATNVVPSGLQFLTAHEGENYAASVQEETVTVSRVAFGRASAVPVATFLASDVVVSFAVARNRQTGSLDFWTVEGTQSDTVLRHYVLNGGAYEGTTVLSGTDAENGLTVAADGNLVWVHLGASNRFRLYGAEGALGDRALATLPDDATPLGLSVLDGRGVIAYGSDGGPGYAAFTY